MKEHYIQALIRHRNAGEAVGICSACSANPFVLRAVMRQSKKHGVPALIEATANQVNQFGGYTGMRPADFAAFVKNIAIQEDFPLQNLILGGDHLGPLVWKDMEEGEAMDRACVLIEEYVKAGFSKIHLDTSMRLQSDDPKKHFGDEIIAARAAKLAAVVQKTMQEAPHAPDSLALVIGSEVPIPGGTQDSEEEMQITTSSQLRATIAAFQEAFTQAGAFDMWKCAVAVVTQPGVEFGDFGIHAYNRSDASGLMQAAKAFPQLTLEGHSTDYQPRQKLREMVEDGVAILKVGPALTFFLREALFSLDRMLQELPAGRKTKFPALFEETLERAMTAHTDQWKKYYKGTDDEQKFKRKYSLSDRARYYLTNPAVENALQRLLSNCKTHSMPLPLLSQFMPIQAKLIQNGELSPEPEELILSHIAECLDDYFYATLPG